MPTARVGAGRERPIHLFVYGTLLPGEVRWPLLEPYVVGARIADAVAGTLYDTGLDYPAAIFGGEDTIVGSTFAIAEDMLEDCLAHLDVVEGTVGGLYSRVVVVTSRGTVAWSYQYGGGLSLRPIPSGSWTDR